ncbi:Heat shock protein GrpE [Moraxella catarrhalis]|nr:Heat shock protein GrpE [Moraxella catarrhalis]
MAHLAELHDRTGRLESYLTLAILYDYLHDRTGRLETYYSSLLWR